MDVGEWCMELMKEGGKEVGTLSNLLNKRRRRRGRMTFSSAKKRRLRVQKKREASSSDGINMQPLWRLSCKICSIHLESILEEEVAASSVVAMAWTPFITEEGNLRDGLVRQELWNCKNFMIVI